MKHTGLWKALFKSRNGNTGIIIICIILVVVLVAAVLTDVTYMAVERYKLEGLAERLVCSSAEALAAGKADLIKTIKDDALKKECQIENLDIKFPSNGKEVSVYIQKRINYIFLSFFGMNEKEITAQVTVKVSSVSSCKGIRPIGILKGSIKYDTRVTLSNLPVKGNPGIIFIDTGSKSFDTDIKYGSLCVLSVGDTLIPYEHANPLKVCDQLEVLIAKCRHLPQCTIENHAAGCSRIILLPVVSKEKGYAQNALKLTGFCAFFMENAESDGNYLKITGSFIRHVIKSDTSDGVSDFGLRGIKIIR